MSEAVIIKMFSYVPLRTRVGLAGFLDVLEAMPDLTPTYWGQDERARNPYDRQEMIEQIVGGGDPSLTPGLRHPKGIRYEAFFSAHADGLGYVDFDLTGVAESDIPRLFTLADALADYFQPVLGFIHRFWNNGARSQEYDAAGRLSIGNLQKYGLDQVCARTWYGPRLTDLIGLPLLEASGASVHPTPWGGTRIDLTERPWGTPPEELAAVQAQVMKTLTPSQAYGDYADFFNQKPGVRWTPLPDTRPILPVARWPQPARP